MSKEVKNPGSRNKNPNYDTMSHDDRVKQERSHPVSARIDLVNLARIALYYQTQGMHIRTMSQLVNWSVDLLCEVLIANDALDTSYIATLADAVNYLSVNDLIQTQTKHFTKRVQKKLSTALRYETLREKGIDPKTYGKREGSEVEIGYGELHRRDSIVPPPNMGVVHKTLEETVAEAIKAGKESGLIVGDDWTRERQQKDRERIEQENAPIKQGDLKIVDE